jgi:hypothetical protein
MQRSTGFAAVALLVTLAAAGGQPGTSATRLSRVGDPPCLMHACIYVTSNHIEQYGNPEEVAIWPVGAQGDVFPAERIVGRHSRLQWPIGVAVSPAHEIVVVESDGGYEGAMSSTTLGVTGRAERSRVKPPA